MRSPSREEDRFAAPDAACVLGDALTLGLAAFAYDGPLRKALQRLKYTGTARVAAPLAAAATPAIESLLRISGPAVFVPVPVHLDRERERGYNQAELLARQLARLTGAEVRRALVRQRPTTKQHILDRSARLRNLRDAFAAASGVLAPPVAVVVDDIVTTSATLESCAAALRDAGTLEAFGFAIAREV